MMMLFYDRKGNRFKASGMMKEPKFLSLPKEKKKLEKVINDEPIIFYQKPENNKYIHFKFRGEWFKGPSELFEKAEELFDADHLLLL